MGRGGKGGQLRARRGRMDAVETPNQGARVMPTFGKPPDIRHLETYEAGTLTSDPERLRILLLGFI